MYKFQIEERKNPCGSNSLGYEMRGGVIPWSGGGAAVRIMSLTLCLLTVSADCVCLVWTALRVGLIYIYDCTRTARVKLPKLSFPQ